MFATRIPAPFKWCNTCNKMREPGIHGTDCLCCGQYLDAKPGDPCYPCDGEGVLVQRGLEDCEPAGRCPMCNGSGTIPMSTCACGRQAPSGLCSECAERNTAA